MVRVTTKSKRQITTTMSHSHLKRTSEKIVPVRGDELKIGDRIPVIMKQQLFEQNKSIQIPNIGQFNLDNHSNIFFFILNDLSRFLIESWFIKES